MLHRSISPQAKYRGTECGSAEFFLALIDTERWSQSASSPLSFCYSFCSPPPPPSPLFSQSAICFSELDRFGQSDSHHCVAVGMNRTRGETHCHYVVTIRCFFFFFLSLSPWMLLSLVSVCLPVSLSRLLIYVLRCLDEYLTLCCLL